MQRCERTTVSGVVQAFILEAAGFFACLFLVGHDPPAGVFAEAGLAGLALDVAALALDVAAACVLSLGSLGVYITRPNRDGKSASRA